MFKKYFSKKAEIIKNTNPDRIYVENIRSFFNISTKLAKYFCEVAVRQNLFKKKYGVICKNSDCNRILFVYDDIKSIPDELECFICESEEKEIYQFKKDDLKIVEFYQLVNNEDR